MINPGRKVTSFQEWVESFDLELLPAEERETLQKGAKNLILNPTLARMLAQLEAVEINAMVRAQDEEMVLKHHARVKIMRDFRRQILGLAQDLNFEKKQTQKQS